ARSSATCTTSFVVTDNTAPTVICSATPSAFADANCQATVPNVLGGVSVSDSCTPTNAITLTQSPLAGTLVGLGTNTITVTATDAAGNSATCTTSFVVTDNTAPTVICSATPSAFADANCQAAVPNVLGGVSVSDSCSPTNAITLTQSPLAGTLVGLGTNTITVTATDAAGNSATCTTTFTVDTSISATRPGDLETCQGQDANFATAANGVGSFEYQWRLDGNAVGTNGPTLTQSTTELSPGDHLVQVEVRGQCGLAATNVATLTVLVPTMATAPVDLMLTPGESARFSTSASGIEPHAYQWRKDGVDIA